MPESTAAEPHQLDTIAPGHPRRETYLAWLREITARPTAAGHEARVLEWVHAWLGERPDLAARTDAHGNVEVRFAGVTPGDDDRPVYFTAHLDHPAFVCCGSANDANALLEFRGGVMAEYFEQARVEAFPAGATGAGDGVRGVLTGQVWDPKSRDEETDSGGGATRGGVGGLFPVYTFLPDEPERLAELQPGDVARWELPEPEVIDDEFGGIFHTHACDDLAALAAALAALEELRLARAEGHATADVRVLLTLAEEIGFVGAIGACEDRFMPAGSRIIALENSRSFPDSPIHGGPIVRVGDRISVFSPELTAAVSEVARGIAGRDAQPRAQEKDFKDGWKWQRKLMAGGACEASVFCAYGYEATCVCLPLGNYHNMASLAEVQAGTFEGTPRVGREHIGVDDFFGMVDLLAACGQRLGDRPGFRQRVEKLWEERRWVLEQD
ncbi:MAG: hypothetical protein ACF8SC_07885 [Phycisphaerales bacterium JB037]